jgi:glycosyltransferase involved in cell wall biosynthesis
MTTPISAVIITYNEEKNIERCIRSLEGVADEVVVVDSLSSDETVNIANKFGAKVYSQAFLGYVEQKNFALTKTIYPHVLSLDADEALSEKLKQSILKVKSHWTHDGYYFNRLTNYCGKWIKHTSLYPSKKLRLWDKRKGSWGGTNPHDIFILKKGSTQKFLKGDLLHYSFSTIDQHMLKVNLFSRIFAESHFKKGRRATGLNLFFNPVWRFFRDYIIKLGFVEGIDGLTVCAISSYETFIKYRKLIYIQRQNRNIKGDICLMGGNKCWEEEKWLFDAAIHLAEKKIKVIAIVNKPNDLLAKLRSKNIPTHVLRINPYSFLNPFKLNRLVHHFRKLNISTIVISCSSYLKIAGIAAKFAGIKNIIYKSEIPTPLQESFPNNLIFKNLTIIMVSDLEELKHSILKNSNHPILF